MSKQKTKNRTRFFEIKFFCAAQSFIANAIAVAKRSALANPHKSLLISLSIITILISIPILSNIKQQQNSNAATPQVDRIFPTVGTPAGGDKVVIEGKNFESSTIKRISDGNSHNTCVVGNDDKVYCWGYNLPGTLGNGLSTNSAVPVATVQGAVPNGVNLIRVSVSGYYTCAIGSNGKAYCWGYGGTTSPTALPQGSVPANVSFVNIAAGYNHSCAVGTDSKIYCWNSASASPTVVAQGSIPLNIGIKQISAGHGDTCVLALNNKVYCWGTNFSATPTEIPQGSIPNGVSLLQISSGWYHTCGVGSNSKVYCWGQNTVGQLGNGSNVNSNSPVEVSQGEVPVGVNFKQVSGGGAHTCAVGDNNKVYCWGGNNRGQLGNNSLTDSTTPVEIVSGGMNSDYVADAVITGGRHSCAKISTGRMYCWGANEYGQLGNGIMGGSFSQYNPGIDSLYPVAMLQGSMPPLSSGTKVSINNTELPSSSIKFINSNKLEITMPAHAEGKVNITLTNPDNTTTTITNAYEYHTPKAPTITSISPNSSNLTGGQTATITGTNFNTFKWKQISAGNYHTCAIASNNQAYCWGWNYYGQLANGATYTPVAVSQGAIPSGVTLTQIAAGSNHTCALASNNQTYCWGENQYGQLGNGTTITSNTPVVVSQGAIPSGVTLTQIAAGSNHTCAIASNNQAYCWGRNDLGQLGNGSTTQSNTPVAISRGAIPSGVTLTQIAAGYYHTCTLASNNQTYCWGENQYGQLGNNSTTNSSTPVAISQGAIPSGVTLTQIAAGVHYTCALASNNQTYCWGRNSNGQLGNNSTTNSSTPVAISQGAIPSGVTLTQIAAGHSHACALASSNQTYCWGRNSNGQLGNNSTIQSNTPVAISQGAIPSGVTLTQISVGVHYTCALASNNQTYCWGDNQYGQLGNGTTTNSLTPTTVHHTFTINLSPGISIPVSIPSHNSDTALSFTIPAHATPSFKDVSITNKLANLNSNTLTQAFRYYTKSNPPTNLTISNSQPTNSLTLTWTSPSTGGIDSTPNQGNNFSPIADYQIDYCIADPNNLNQCQDPTNSTPTTTNPTNWLSYPHTPIQSTVLTNLSTKITNLNPDQHYLIRIAAINQAGLSTYLTSQAKVPSYVSVSTDAANLSLNTTPLYSNTYTNASLTATVGTNLSTGYVLRLSTVANNNQLSTAANHHINPTTHTFLNPGALQSNTWGYYIPNTTANQQHNTVTLSQFTSQDTNFTNQNQDTNRYCQLPTSQSPQIIAQYNQAVQNKTLQLIIGSNIAQTQASGVYTNTIRLEAVGN